MSNSTESQPNGQVPDAVSRLGELMATYPAPWALCGGWAVDAWLGRLTREHGDVDLSVFVHDQRSLFEHLGGWQLVPHVRGNEGELWDGRRVLDHPGHIHARIATGEAAPPPGSILTVEEGFFLDIQLDDREGDGWILLREPRITVPLATAIRRSPWGLPTVAPEILLF
ncbi:MAG: nucleotidyltransferase domain-containing protein, partial [Gemmatimonadaceae bacterium]